MSLKIKLLFLYLPTETGLNLLMEFSLLWFKIPNSTKNATNLVTQQSTLISWKSTVVHQILTILSPIVKVMTPAIRSSCCYSCQKSQLWPIVLVKQTWNPQVANHFCHSPDFQWSKLLFIQIPFSFSHTSNKPSFKFHRALLEIVQLSLQHAHSTHI